MEVIVRIASILHNYESIYDYTRRDRRDDPVIVPALDRSHLLPR